MRIQQSVCTIQFNSLLFNNCNVFDLLSSCFLLVIYKNEQNFRTTYFVNLYKIHSHQWNIFRSLPLNHACVCYAFQLHTYRYKLHHIADKKISFFSLHVCAWCDGFGFFGRWIHHHNASKNTIWNIKIYFEKLKKTYYSWILCIHLPACCIQL